MRSRLLTIALCLLIYTEAFTAVPKSITVQGRLTDASGVPLAPGVKGFLFRIFDAQSGGTLIWAGEDQFLPTDADGLWSAQVGAIVGLTDAVFSDTVRWLDINVMGTQLPRVRLVTGPYANRVSTVDGASGGTITSKIAIGPGHSNLGQDAFIAGNGNTVGGDFSAVGGGAGNSANGFYATVNGGLSNSASGSSSAVGGGTSNTASGIGSTVSGGEQNSTAGSFTGTIGGGAWNRVSANYATVGGGQFDTASGANATVAGGQGNAAAGQRSTIGGGQNNKAYGDWSFVGGGHTNVADGDSSIVVGGTRNTANGRGAVVVGGSENHARGNFSFIGGGGGMFADSNAAHGDFAVAVGGNHAIARGDFSFVGGGYNNRAYDNYTFVGGGQNNIVETGHSTVVGGLGNWSAESGSFKFIGGGRGNFVDASFATIAGGDSNSVAGFQGVIAGGRKNRVSALGAACIGGVEDTASGAYSVTLGGFRNKTGSLARYSLAAGKRAKANHAGCFVWADSTDADFVSTDTSQFLVRASGGMGVGTNNPEGMLHVQDGSAGAVTANANSAAVFESDGSTWISILGPSSSEKGILFSDPGSSIAGGIIFDEGAGGNDLAFRTGGNTTRLTLDAAGNLTADGCVAGSNIACPSDARFKRKIETLPNALKDVAKLRGVRYEWEREKFADREFPPGQQVGLIAQEVREVVPQAVVEQSDGYLAVDYARLVPLLIEGMKAQQRIIEQQDNRITQLEQRLEQ